MRMLTKGMRGQLSRSKVVEVDRKLEKSDELEWRGFGHFARSTAPNFDSFGGDSPLEVLVLLSYFIAPRVASPWLPRRNSTRTKLEERARFEVPEKD